MEDTLTIKKEKKEILVKECQNCFSEDLIPVKDHEHCFEETTEKHDGVICNNCGCFHFELDDGINYEYNYENSFEDKEIEWKINSN